jgi:uncharacterized membrane protein YgdD (TMEM256/DUF423 family)
MRLLNVFAALSGLMALIALIYAAHAVNTAAPDAATSIERIKLAAFIQIGAAAAGLAVANRIGRLNLIAGALILVGAAIFSGTLYAVSMLHAPATLAPVGGITLLLGWLTLAFARPGAP